MIHKLFVYSKVSVCNEVKNGWKYFRLTYVEFLEFVCRVALELVEQKGSKI